jgi:hypothetical protein
MTTILFMLLLLASASVFAVQFYVLRTIYNKHRVAVRFRVVKCSVIDLLYNESFSQRKLSSKDLLALRKIYAQLVYDLDQLKSNTAQFFSASNFLKLSMQGMRQQLQFPDQFKNEHHQVLAERRKAADAMLFAFGILVPLLKFKVFYVLLRLGLRLMILLGKKQFTALYEMLGSSSKLVREVKVASSV